MPDSPRQNLLLDRLPDADRSLLLSDASAFAFPVGHVFSEPGDPAPFVHFIRSGIVSAVATMEDGRTVETFMVGPEGATDVWATAGLPRGFSRLVAQTAGESWRLEAGRLQAAMAARPAVRQVMSEYGAVLQSELEQSIACNALHRAEQRLAKWLLRCHDRIDGDSLSLTQEYLASMLGSQRTTVNEAAQALQRAGAIVYSRGKVTIASRAALARTACERYRAGGRPPAR